MRAGTAVAAGVSAERVRLVRSGRVLVDGVDCTLPVGGAGGGGGGGATQPPCALGQDETVPCQLCRDAREACRTP